METELPDMQIILITKNFPFDTMNAPAENYLINEIQYLAAKVKKVIVIATDAHRDSRLSVDLPPNVMAYNVADTRARRKLNILCSLIKYFALPLETDKDEIGHSLKKRLRYAYFNGKSDYYFNCIREKLIDRKVLNKDSNMVFYTFWFYTYTLTAYNLKKKYFNHAEIITRTHRYDLYSERNSLNYIPMRKYLFDRIDMVFPCSEDGSKYLREKYPEYSSKIKTSYLGSEDYGGNSNNGNQLFTVVSCSRVEPVKRLDILVRTMQCISNMDKSIQWIHIGNGSQMHDIKLLAKELVENGRIAFAGAMDNKKVMEFYQTHKVDLFVNVSESEGLPISIMEAASMGIPVLATDVGGTREIVDDSNGWLIPKDVSAQELASIILNIREMDSVTEQKKRKASREKWQQFFNIEDNITKLLGEINQ